MPTPTPFPRNQWYVAAYTSEIGHELFARTICSEPIVFYRTEESGEVTALADRCVHRRFPLSESRLDGDRVVCGYHGFTYDRTGGCVYVPGQQRIPRTARVAAYPVVEQDSLVWIWIGDPALADAAAVPRAPWLDREGWTTVRGMEPLAARYSLLVDNLLDLSHETYLHGGYIGTPEVAETPITTEVDEEAGMVRVSRRMADAACPPFYAESTGLKDRISRWQDIEYFAPCLYQLHSRIAPVGSVPAADGSDPEGFHMEIFYAITPETETSTHDFWAVSRDFCVDDAKISEFVHQFNREVVLQDVVALDKLERVIAEEPEGVQELSINIDTGGLAARRLLKRLVEQGEKPLETAP
ncbi:aromatic ring-hydroxylating dioxygenase subunit alpha [Phaeacidiphilus oryzae]|uniref:aromatic ring-hydroxylating dioxygenase subunit alpha n=1 Tax=Phaeacidiphilus oryzae TaxID=348818 RepID=UPI0005688E9F|nr:aromatic ring-hydroxylating dioxygenase subunit alpha [Phaeacidiphilus oryzae]